MTDTEIAEATRTNYSTAPFPYALEGLVNRAVYKGWSIRLIHQDRGTDGEGLTLVITSLTEDAYAPPVDRRLVQDTVCGMAHPRMIYVNHNFIVPAATYDERAWRRWLFDQCVLVELHEAMEAFKIDGSRPFAPNHGPGRNPYSIHERGTEVDANSDQRGEPAGRPA